MLSEVVAAEAGAIEVHGRGLNQQAIAGTLATRWNWCRVEAKRSAGEESG